ncbi:hypothetical protein CRE_22324 [Caenorhabditis remanei]|uniref:Uncharacterized protein n=1 Tax=Caenorhabditis remanei TaxID=31234 RepID=E3ME40_CAERE|nr:hypothetical protein CRE_22324 [Caenorhabditis remanei]
MGTVYEEEMGTSILLVYCSDNDSPDKFFPADPRLVQAHWDSQNEKKPPPTPPASPVSGMVTPSTGLMSEVWEVERSLTPSPTFDVPMPQNLVIEENRTRDAIGQQLELARLQINQNSNDVVINNKRSVTFSLKLEYIEYHHHANTWKAELFNSGLKKMKKSKKLGRNKKIRQGSECRGCHECRISQATVNSQNVFRKIAKTVGLSSSSRTYSRISSVVRRVCEFTSRIVA